MRYEGGRAAEDSIKEVEEFILQAFIRSSRDGYKELTRAALSAGLEQGGISESDLRSAIGRMKSHGLLQTRINGIVMYFLTEAGQEVASRQKERPPFVSLQVYTRSDVQAIVNDLREYRTKWKSSVVRHAGSWYLFISLEKARRDGQTRISSGRLAVRSSRRLAPNERLRLQNGNEPVHVFIRREGQSYIYDASGKIASIERRFLHIALDSAEAQPIHGSSTELIAEPSGDELDSITVYYGTNRALRADGGFDARRANMLQLGTVEVFAPIDRESGNDGFEVVERQPMAAAEFIRESESQEDVFDLLYVHGYCSSFDSAVCTAAQLGLDLRVDGKVFAFSWPSLNKWYLYPRDEPQARASFADYIEFLKLILVKSSARRLIVVAHSMGNLVVAGAMNLWKYTAVFGPPLPPHLNTFIMAAPDIDSEEFSVNWSTQCVARAECVILYASTFDKALIASKWFRLGRRRLGQDIERCAENAGIETVDSSNVYGGPFGHGYFNRSVRLLRDMHDVIRRVAPEDRWLKADMAKNQGPYWRFSRENN